MSVLNGKKILLGVSGGISAYKTASLVRLFIKEKAEVQVVMNMDGWGPKAQKIGTYKNFIFPEPVQFTGFKLFYKNDIWEPGTVMFSPKELMDLNPRPIYIQYQ